MSLSEKLLFLLCGPGVSLLVIYFILWLLYRPATPIEVFKSFFADVWSSIFNFFHYFFGYSCIVCGKKYFSAKKAHNCCIHKTELHFQARQKEIAALQRYRQEYGATPKERRRKSRERFIGHFKRYSCSRCGKKHWTGSEAHDCCKNKPTPPDINVDTWLCDCYWCGGEGYKFGTICNVCGGLGKLPRG